MVRVTLVAYKICEALFKAIIIKKTFENQFRFDLTTLS